MKLTAPRKVMDRIEVEARDEYQRLLDLVRRSPDAGRAALEQEKRP